MARYKVVILDDEKEMDDFYAVMNRRLGDDVEIMRVNQFDTAAIALACADCDGILNPLVSIDGGMMDGMTRCRVIVKMGIGHDNIDSAAAAARGIMVANTPDYCEGEVADHALALLLAVNRRIALSDRQVRRGVWNDTILHPDTPRLSECVFGVLGCGKIGRNAARRAEAFGMGLVGYDPFLDAAALAAHRIEKIDDLDEFLGRADFVSLHIPSTGANRNLINKERLARMKRSAVLINTARGAVVNEADLAEALRNGTIAGAGLDVQLQEPPKQPSPFNGLDNVVLTPHTAYYSAAADKALRVLGAEAIADAFQKGRPASWVNRNGFVPRNRE
ncbi:MAG: C-terminal binding protein [Planctomycetota bacterium]|nr:C-terminal binding protein [Planctomycetota bacterium]